MGSLARAGSGMQGSGADCILWPDLLPEEKFG